jgi:hypothetical protein
MHCRMVHMQTTCNLQHSEGAGVEAAPLTWSALQPSHLLHLLHATQVGVHQQRAWQGWQASRLALLIALLPGVQHSAGHCGIVAAVQAPHPGVYRGLT